MTSRQDTVLLHLVPDPGPGLPLAPLLADLSPAERLRADTCRDADTRRRYVLAHAALRRLLAERLGTAPAELRWRHGPHGKPALPGDGPRFNLSHSGAFALVALSPARPVGVDIQRVLPRTDTAALADRYFPPEEARRVRSAADPAGCFARLWAGKEALVKAHGGRLVEGLRVPLEDTPAPAPEDAWSLAYRVAPVPAPPGYHAAVALAGTAPFRVTARRWAWPRAGSSADGHG
ncbi:4'-phosphopantetheinyl transferase family protein [Kitasatospora phosalacinea]|uniref:4'-phosphopantetheinyl transferase family protein n=1 Tax=Kitasatospora phosalacinea TaxID=2065 RepID=UPI00068F4554|nr:4'-phosphopantetheinyl transferase superfamily protein [Kitasatospora phosalacinea]